MTGTLGQRRSAARLKVAFFSVKATRNQSARWGFWARKDRARSVGAWLEVLADQEVKLRETERGVYDLPAPPYAATN